MSYAGHKSLIKDQNIHIHKQNKQKRRKQLKVKIDVSVCCHWSNISN